MSPRCALRGSVRTPRAARRARRAWSATRTPRASTPRTARPPSAARAPSSTALAPSSDDRRAAENNRRSSGRSSRRRIISAGPRPSSDGSMPRSTQERRAHAERDVERRHEAQVEPVRAFEGDPLAERPADRVCRDKHPLRARALVRAETSELGDEWIHTTSLRRLTSAYVRPEPELAIVPIGNGRTCSCSAHAYHTLDVRPSAKRHAATPLTGASLIFSG